ncbi:MAG: hypothetical protein R3A44_17430 [Caldilineaceae bacterium]
MRSGLIRPWLLAIQSGCFTTLYTAAADLLFSNSPIKRPSTISPIAHAFLDLVDAQSSCQALARLLKPEGSFYSPINFD